RREHRRLYQSLRRDASRGCHLIMKIVNPIRAPHILLPKAGVDMNAFAVIACDQFTSQRDYWDGLKKMIGSKPSTFHMIFPEAYLNLVDEKEYIKGINKISIAILKKALFKISVPVLFSSSARRHTPSGGSDSSSLSMSKPILTRKAPKL
ncbi:MAG TPA: DUF1015 family protein, partial [Bacilli bacterium]|nr:DUF1015 family protein [Bacilli bacterium]